MTRLQLFGAAIAAGISLWAVMDVKSFLYAFLIAFFVCMAGVGMATVMGGVSRECPTQTYSDEDLERMEFENYLRALDDVTRRTS